MPLFGARPLVPARPQTFMCKTAALALWLAAGLAPALASDDGPKDGWDGEIALGASAATGNTNRQALDLDIKASHRAGRVEDLYTLSGEFAREDGNTTASRVNAGVQSNIDINDRFYALGFADVERDRFSGYRYEAELGVGVGYRVIDRDNLSLDVELAPGYRHGEIRGIGNENRAYVRGTVRVEYQISDNATLSNETLIAGDSDRVRIEDTLALTATIINNFAARLSFNIRHNTNPPAGAEKTDTVSKAQLVYGF